MSKKIFILILSTLLIQSIHSYSTDDSDYEDYDDDDSTEEIVSEKHNISSKDSFSELLKPILLNQTNELNGTYDGNGTNVPLRHISKHIDLKIEYSDAERDYYIRSRVDNLNANQTNEPIKTVEEGGTDAYEKSADVYIPKFSDKHDHTLFERNRTDVSNRQIELESLLVNQTNEALNLNESNGGVTEQEANISKFRDWKVEDSIAKEYVEVADTFADQHNQKISSWITHRNRNYEDYNTDKHKQEFHNLPDVDDESSKEVQSLFRTNFIYVPIMIFVIISMILWILSI